MDKTEGEKKLNFKLNQMFESTYTHTHRPDGLIDYGMKSLSRFLRMLRRKLGSTNT